MPGEWRVLRLGDVVELKRGYDLPSREREPGSIPVVSSSGSNGSHSKAMVRGPGVVTGRYGTIGLVFFVRQDFWPLNTTLYVRDFKGNDPLFVSFLLRTIDFHSCSDKAAVPGVNRNHLHELPVSIPPLSEQRSIAAILGSLDDKIEVNRRVNETLDELARTIFESWFVDFNPVRARIERKQTIGADAETAALFPSRFVESELGEIPEGWKIMTLGELCERTGGDIQTGPFGSQLHASDYVDEGVPSVMPKDLKEDRICSDDVARIREEDAVRLSRYRLQVGDIVYSRRGDVERSALVTRREDGWLCGTGCLRVRLGRSGAEPVYLFGAVTTDRARSWVVRHAHGATMPNLNTTILGQLPLCVPPLAVQVAYRSAAGPLINRRDHNWDENSTLGELRDTLLPKLISGELRVSDAERFVVKDVP